MTRRDSFRLRALGTLALAPVWLAFGCGPPIDPLQPQPTANAVASAPSAAIAAPPDPAKMPLEDLGAQVVSWLQAGEVGKVRALFDEEMGKALADDEAVARTWAGVEAKAGKFKRLIESNVAEKDGYHVVLSTCDFELGPMDVRMVFDKDRRLAGLFLRATHNPRAFGPRPQQPSPPFGYEAREVAYDNASDRSHLTGTLTLPRGAGPFPAVLLVTGSGTQDRDETILGHKPFLLIAHQLTMSGFTVLRVDNPGAGGSTGDTGNATIEAHARDVEAGIAFLKAQKEVDPRRIGLIGHSEGAIISAVVGARSRDVGFIVSLAGTGLSGAEINPMQIDALLRAEGKMKEEGIKAIVECQRKLMKLIARDADDKKLQVAVQGCFDLAIEHTQGPASKAAAEKGVAAAMQTLTVPWFKSFVKLDPAAHWRKVKVPVLALNGDKDTQVVAEANLAAIRSALDKGRNKDVEIHKLAGLNHLFQPARTGLLDEYGQIQTTFDPAALELMTAWLKKRADVE